MTQKTPPNTPMLNRLLSVSQTSNKIGQFIDWLEEKKNIELCENLNKFKPEYEDDYIRTPKSITNLLAEFFEIDLNIVETERQAILDSLNPNEN